MTDETRRASEIPAEVLDQLLAGYAKPEDLTGDDGLFRRLKKALIERALGAELTEHLGYEHGDRAGRGSGNSRNGTSAKTILTEDGEIALDVPRDRASTFEPQLVPKGQTRFDGFDEKIISLYARGMTVREIQGHLKELYGTEVSPDLISRVTDAVLDEVREWQNRPLDRVYPIVFFDALRVKIRDDGLVRNKAVYVALALNADGEKEVLGLWVEQNEGAKFWLKVMNELKNRGVEDLLIAVVDGLKGFPEAITAVFPETMVQTCIVHLIRNSLAFVTWKDRKTIMPSIRAIYRAETEELARARLDEFEALWGKRYPAIGQLWRRQWEQVVPFFAFPPAIRKMIYTTNAVEALHRSLRKIIKTRGSFPSDEAAMKLLYLAIRNAAVHWRRPVEWTAAMSQFAIQFGDRFPGSARWPRKTSQKPLTQRIGHSLTFLAALRHDRIDAPCVLDGPINGQLFAVWVEQFLVPTLRPGDIVIMDNLGSHKGKAVRNAIRAAGAKLFFLPPYSPDLNPIEQVFAKLKLLLRKAAERSVEATWKRIGTLLDAFPPHECANYLRNSGYASI